MLNGNDIDSAGSGVEKAGNGLSKFLEGIGKLFANIQRYWKGYLMFLATAVFVFLIWNNSNKYERGYSTAKKEDDDYINTLKLNNEFKDKRILILQKENDTLFKMWNECKQTSYSNITIKTKP